MRRVVPIAAILAACGSGGGGGGGGGGVEAQLGQDVSTQLGVTVTVGCPAGKYPKTCMIHVPGGDDLPLDVADTPDAYQWSLRGFVIATAPLANAIGAELIELGVDGKVDCGPALRPAAVGDRVRCDLALPGGAGAAWARILDDDARYALELELTPAGVAARSQDADDAALERASRALDRDDAEGEGGEGEGDVDIDVGTDAGIALDSAR